MMEWMDIFAALMQEVLDEEGWSKDLMVKRDGHHIKCIISKGVPYVVGRPLILMTRDKARIFSADVQLLRALREVVSPMKVMSLEDPRVANSFKDEREAPWLST